MQPVTIRRLLVFGVCLVGVGCLYLVPSMAGSGQVGSSPPRHDLQTATPVETTASSTIPTFSAVPDPSDPVEEPRSTPSTASSGPASTSQAVPTREATSRTRQPTRSAATPVAPGRDENPPDAVGPLTLVDSDPDQLVVTWAQADDDIGVAGYRVQVNGFDVLVTAQIRATLAWFNDTNTHVVQVRALDEAGNQGPSSPTLLITRPSPAPSPTTPTPSSPPESPAPSPTEVAEETPATNDTNKAAPSPTSTPESSPKENDS